MTAHPVLLVEDNPDDVFIMRYALEKAGLELPVFVASDGNEALEYLQGLGQFENRSRFPLPSLIFLDLKLPYVDGFEVLEWIREHPEFNQTEVIILTSSDEERDQRRARELGIKIYLTKPPRAETLRQVVAPLLQEPVRVCG